MTDTTTQLEDDLRLTRARMDTRLTELQEHLTPGRILDDVMAYVRDSGSGDFGRNLLASVRNNPLPTTVTAIGLAWLMVSGSRGPGYTGTQASVSPGQPSPDIQPAERHFDDLDLRLSNAERDVVRRDNETDDAWRARVNDARAGVVGITREAAETAESFAQRITEAIEKGKESVMRNVHDVRDRAAEAGERGSAIAQAASDKVMQGTQRAKEAGSHLITTIGDNPLLLGGLALGFGALLGALIPQSEQEEAALGDVAAKASRTARDAAQSVIGRGRETAEQVLSAGQRSASAHGLSGETSVGELIAGARSGELLDKVEDTARETLQSAETALRREGSDADNSASSTSSGSSGGMSGAASKGASPTGAGGVSENSPGGTSGETAGGSSGRTSSGSGSFAGGPSGSGIKGS
ncbi:DUF3618 domain-containing protein [Dongia soli]|uniref:DUF3618 domain-containing protein n=1 Tax=Dongia soli TaxID=600628 RepID=A0ABU5ECJ6_9PROT|nr:DUF3618 domain-containing protein [Dongia soli]MDY0883612.1 DUF3618 domain-containing protein [Dongia soli]